MTDRNTQSELDPELEEWLADARDAASAEPPVDLDAMLGDVEQELERADRSWTFWLRSRATWARRGLAFGAAALVVVFGGVLTLRADFGELPLPWTLTAVGSLAVLLGGSLFLALRPLHQPPLPAWVRGSLIATTLAATCALALLAPADAVVGDESFLRHVGPCLFYGLLVGFPIYALLRLLDRGGAALALLAACAGGLTGNLVLQLHCPRGDAEHLMAAHFAVVLFFLGGLGLIHGLLARRRGR